jgi:transglutaminase-like putative cysteine protease
VSNDRDVCSLSEGPPVLVRVQHSLDYLYSRAVFCEPVTIRLRPRDDSFQKLKSWHCTIDPQPAGMSQYRDLDGNLVLRAWFEGLTEHLKIHSALEVETLCFDPFQYLLAPEAAVLPIRLDAIEQSLAATYSKPGTMSPKIAELADELQRQTGKQTTRFLSVLSAHLHDAIKFTVRPTGDPWPPEKTLADRTGSCRDIAVLFCEVCRAAGLPSRFVSGYAVDPDHAGCHHLHAWSEVYLPGAGWRGFDPTLGLAVADRHVSLAAARLPALAAPTSGVYRGTGVTSELTAHVEISAD